MPLAARLSHLWLDAEHGREFGGPGLVLKRRAGRLVQPWRVGAEDIIFNS